MNSGIRRRHTYLFPSNFAAGNVFRVPEFFMQHLLAYIDISFRKAIAFEAKISLRGSA